MKKIRKKEVFRGKDKNARKWGYQKEEENKLNAEMKLCPDFKLDIQRSSCSPFMSFMSVEVSSGEEENLRSP